MSQEPQEPRLPGMPGPALEVLHRRKAAPSTARALTRDEELELLTVASRDAQPYFLLALDAGLRLREITALRAHHYDTRHATLRVPAHTAHGGRTLPLTGRLATALRERLETLSRDGHTTPGMRLLALQRPDSLLWQFHQKLGWRLRFYDLRHTFAHRLHDAGASEIMIAAALGRSWGTTTDRHISTPLHAADLRPAFERMEALTLARRNREAAKRSPAA